MKKIFYSTLILFCLITAFSSLEAGVRVRPSVGFTVGSDSGYRQRPYIVRNYYAQPVIVAPAPAPVVVHPEPVYYTETVVYPAPQPRTFGAFSFFLNFR